MIRTTLHSLNQVNKISKRMIQVLRSINDVRALRKSCILAGKTIGFVPTMGALHQGHITLMKESKKETDIVISSIFVNPTQFSPGEDLDKYPRTFENDVKLMTGIADYVFAPIDTDIYPKIPKRLCHVEPSDFNAIYEGQARPEFFRGVATIVTKLFNIVQPDIAYFGQKDISQCILIRRLVTDLNIPTTIRVIPTVREHDGLAMSSRNVYLSTTERQVANILYQALSTGQHLIEQSISEGDSWKSINRQEVLNAIQTVLQQESLVHKIEYISIASHEDMKELSSISKDTGAVISSAIRLGNVRLIDNVLVGKSYLDIIN